MKALLAVARREIVEKRFVLAAAGVASIIPLFVPVVRQLSGDAAPLAREVTALILAGTLGAGLAVALGVSLFSAELVSRRMGFYFSKPISAGALWAGKLLGAVLLVVAGVVIPLLPTLILNGGLHHLQEYPGGSKSAIATAVAALFLMILLANACAIAIRLGSWLAPLEILAGGTLVLAALALFSRLIPVWMVLYRAHFDLAGHLFTDSAAFLVAVLLLASYRALARGRTAPLIVHRRQFETIWGALAGTLVLGFVYSFWALSAPPDSIDIQTVRAAGPTGWVWLEGSGRGAWNSFLYDTRSGVAERLSVWRLQMNAVSQDGTVAAWAELSGAVNPRWVLRDSGDEPSGPMIVRIRRLDQPHAPVVDTRIGLPASVYSILLSPDGSLLASLEHEQASVFEVKTGRLLGAFHFSANSRVSAAWFATPDKIRVFRRGPSAAPQWLLESFEIDVVHRTVNRTGTLALSALNQQIIRSPSGDRLLIFDPTGPVRLVDARSLAVVATIATSGGFGADGVFRSDGGILLVRKDKNESWVELLSLSGAPEGRIPLGGHAWPRLGVESASGAFPVELRDRDEYRLMLVDPRLRSARPVARNLAPLPASWYRIETHSLPAGCEAGKLFLGVDLVRNHRPLSLVHFDPETGEKRVLLGSR